ncbi:MBL fold metallo-hydrolase [Candidatus Frankia nodulisporulans]|uniref:MBL fold metallo-hydrolase n=1 Tax=Candidatus Frankia nodulisporulans TaxID=2060052 RepID=UPI001CDC2ED1|nr:MBL fold metallo-hydrolase [Candidatus Frankia nodulisporulans]
MPRQVTPLAAVLLAPNPGPMTLDGTNTWLLRAPGHTGAVVVDPGPDLPEHLDAIAAAGPIALILLTHGHSDHSAGAAALHRRTGAPVRALDPAHRLGDEGLAAGDMVARPGFELRVLPTPGHTADSLSFLLTGADTDPAVLTGDTILGRGSTVVAHPDGRLGDYLESLRLLRELGETTVLPGHGPELPAAGAAARHYLAHRHARLEQVRAALAAMGVEPERADAAEVVRRVYTDTDRALWLAAELSVRAQLAYLRDHPTLP